MRWRRLTQGDLEECLAIAPERAGAEDVGWDRALLHWRRILRLPAFAGVAIQDSARPEILACGMAAFVNREFAQRELANPQPGLNRRIITSFETASPAVLTLEQLARENAGATLNLVTLYANWRRDLLTDHEVGMVMTLNAVSYLELHNGYRVERLLAEAVDEGDARHARSVAAWRVVSEFEEYFAANPESTYSRERLLAAVTRESCLTDAGTVAMPLFQHREPVFGLPYKLQVLVLHALYGLADAEIARVEGISISTVRARWAQLFEHLSHLLDSDPPGARSTRGPEKRSRVLQLLRERPEELRPYEKLALSSVAT